MHEGVSVLVCMHVHVYACRHVCVHAGMWGGQRQTETEIDRETETDREAETKHVSDEVRGRVAGHSSLLLCIPRIKLWLLGSRTSSFTD